jgi:hypothetical protein
MLDPRVIVVEVLEVPDLHGGVYRCMCVMI